MKHLTKRKSGKFSIPAIILLVVCIFGRSSQAQTSIYIFDPNQSTILQTGGIAGINRTYAVEGQFQLTVDFEAGTASFDEVDANAVDDSQYMRTLDPNEVFAMTSLVGIATGDGMIEFTGYSADGSSILISANIADGTVSIKAQTTPPPNSADFFIFSMDAVTNRKYAGGTGEPNNPYQIATAEDLILLGETPEDYDKHFILTADIDLDPNLPGRKVFDKAVIAPDTNDIESDFQGTSFNGVFDGNGYILKNLHIEGDSYIGLFGQLGSVAMISNLGIEAVDVNGTGILVGALVGWNEYGIIAVSYSTGTVTGDSYVGGLVGWNEHGNIAVSYSTATVTGSWDVGGLVGWNGSGNITTSYSTATTSGVEWFTGGLVGSNDHGSIAASYSTGAVTGGSSVGGLVGWNGGSIATSYSSGMVTGNEYVGGIVGWNGDGSITSSFWDIETSGQTTSAGGTRKTTAEMQTESTFTNAGWDFVNETVNGIEDIWWIDEGKVYPRLWWELIQDDN